jgi:hypothetical protein
MPPNSAPATDLTGRVPLIWPAHRPAELVQVIGWALAITLGQVFLACLLSGQGHLADAYLRLWAWDGVWFGRIVDFGYQSPPVLAPHDEVNVAFFPGYPLFARLLKGALEMPTPYALVFAGQLSCWGFWMYLLLFFQRWRVPGSLAAVGVGAVLVQPASFFLVAGYSESFFLLNLLGFLYWAESRHPAAAPVAALHGLLMTATRIVGVPLVIAPAVHVLVTRDGPGLPMRRLVRALLVGAGAGLGCVLFFAFCQWRFGHWDMYMRANEAGWGVQPHYRGLFSMRIFHVGWPRWSQGFIDPEYLSRLSVPVTLGLFAALLVAQWRLGRTMPDSGWRQRAAYLVCAWLLFYVPVSAHLTRSMSSMIRFSLCVQVMLALAVVHLLVRTWPLRRSRRWLMATAVVWALVSASFQLALTYRFTHGRWVA